MNKIDFENTTIQELREQFINQGNKIIELQRKLNLANEELATYRKSVEKLSIENILNSKEKKSTEIEIPANDLARIMEKALNYDDEKINDLVYTHDIRISWNGFMANIIWGPWVFNSDIIEAIRYCYEEINE